MKKTSAILALLLCAVTLFAQEPAKEEGLFCDWYATSNVTVENTASLLKLAPLFALGIRPTLFCAYPVLQDARSRAILTHLRDTFGCELALHLHHWNTPHS